MDLLWLRSLHILGAVVLLGTGLGTAFQLWSAGRGGSALVIAEVARATVRADWIFTAPAVALQPVTGLGLALGLGYPLDSAWILAAVALYLVAGVCWLPVVGLQMRIARLAQADAARGGAPGTETRRLLGIWFRLGWPAFLAVLVILHLMVFRPELWPEFWPLGAAS